MLFDETMADPKRDRVFAAAILGCMTIGTSAYIWRMANPRKNTRSEPPKTLFGVPIVKDFPVPSYFTIHDIVGKIHLSFGKEIADGVMKKATEVKLQRVRKDGIQVFIRTPGGAMKSMAVGPHQTVGELRSVIEETEDIPRNYIMLIHGMVPLEDAKTMTQCEISKGSTVHIRIRHIGGSREFAQNITSKNPSIAELHDNQIVAPQAMTLPSVGPRRLVVGVLLFGLLFAGLLVFDVLTCLTYCVQYHPRTPYHLDLRG
jgi:hypothetical protein